MRVMSPITFGRIGASARDSSVAASVRARDGARPLSAMTAAQATIPAGSVRTQLRTRALASASSGALNISGSMVSGSGAPVEESDGALIGAEAATGKEVAQAQLEQVTIMIPVIERLPLYVRAIPATELYLELPMSNPRF